LRVGHSQERAGIDADELDKESRDAREHQVGGENFTGLSAGKRGISAARVWFCFGRCGVIRRAQLPEPPGDGAGGDEFIDGCGVYALDRGDESVGKAHAPRQPCWDSIVTVAGKKAADAADAISEGGGRRARIENCKQRYGTTDGCVVPGDAPGDESECGKPREQAAEPGESVRAEE